MGMAKCKKGMEKGEDKLDLTNTLDPHAMKPSGMYASISFGRRPPDQQTVFFILTILQLIFPARGVIMSRHKMNENIGVIQGNQLHTYIDWLQRKLGLKM